MRAQRPHVRVSFHDAPAVDEPDWVSQQGVLLCAGLCLVAAIVYLRYCGLNPAADEDPEHDEPAGLRFHLPRRPAVLYTLAGVLFGLALLCHVAAALWAVV